MFGFQKKKKVVQKIVVQDSGDESVEEIFVSSTSLKPQALLSFDCDEDEGETFKLKKTSTKSIKTKIKKVKPKSTQQPALQQESKCDTLQIIPDMEETTDETISTVLKAGIIPDAKMIFAARKQRQFARETLMAGSKDGSPDKDNIVTARHNENIFSKITIKEKGAHSRLIREDDYDLSDEGEDGAHLEEFNLGDVDFPHNNGRLNNGSDSTHKFVSTRQKQSTLLLQNTTSVKNVSVVNKNTKYLTMSAILEKESAEKYESKRQLLRYLEEQNDSQKGELKESNKTPNKDVPLQDSDPSEKDSEEEEFERWENEQIKKGYNMPQLLNLPSKRHAKISNIMQNLVAPSNLIPLSDPLNPASQILHTAYLHESNQYINNSNNIDENDKENQYNMKGYNVNNVNSVSKGIPDFILSSTTDQASSLKETSNFNTDSIKRDIQKRIDELKGTIGGFKSDLSTTIEFQAGNTALYDDLALETEKIETENGFYEQFKEYIEDLIDCHNEKMGTVFALENRIQNLWKQKATRLLNRRIQDIKDESQEYSLNQILNKSGKPYQTDDQSIQRRIAEREARRGRRRRAREDEKNEFPEMLVEGYSSDDEEMRADMEAYASQIESIKAEASTIFADVVEDYCDIALILTRFEAWKTTNPTSYKEAYINLYLSAILQNLVRYHCLTWNPLNDILTAETQFQNSSWFKALLFHITKPTSEYVIEIKPLLLQNTTKESIIKQISKIDFDESDTCTVTPHVIQNVFLPKLSYLIQHVYDPLSHTQTQSLVEFLEYLANIFPFFRAENFKIQDLYKLIQQKFCKSLENDIYIPIYPSNLIDPKNHALLTYQNRQFWTALKLVQNIVAWKNILSTELIKELAIDGILNRYLVIALQNSPLTKTTHEKCLKIFQIIKLIRPVGVSDSTEFQPFSRYVQFYRQNLKNSGSGAQDLSPIEKREIIESLSEILKYLE